MSPVLTEEMAPVKSDFFIVPYPTTQLHPAIQSPLSRLFSTYDLEPIVISLSLITDIRIPATSGLGETFNVKLPSTSV